MIGNVLKVGKDTVKAAKKVEKKIVNTTENSISTVIKNGRVSVDDLKINSHIFSEKSVDDIAMMLKESGYDVTVQVSAKSRSGAYIIKINNTGKEKILHRFKFPRAVEDTEVIHI